MTKKVLVLLVASGLVTAGIAFAGTTKCKVTNVSGDTVVMDCGTKASALTAGQTVKVKRSSKTAAIEGC